MGIHYCQKAGINMHRFFVEENQVNREEKCIRIHGNDVNHIKNVLRMTEGEKILISCGDEWEYTCAITQVGSEEILASIINIEETGRELPSKIYLFQALPKSDKLELIIQKTVELGVFQIIPVETKNCVVKLDAKKKESKIKRWQAIAESAAKQSKRMIIPEIQKVMKFSDAIKYAQELDVCMIPYELAENMQHTRQFFEQIKPGQSIGIFIGPEGGFSSEEVKSALEHEIEPVTLGKRILRTETAGLAVMSILMYLLEDKSC